MKVTNVIIAGIGGQGVLKVSDILAGAAFACGCDVKKSEMHGMSQRGGSVTSDVRFGDRVFSPMVPWGQADYLIVLEADQIELNRSALRAGGVLLTSRDIIDEKRLPNRRCLNVALLGALSHYFNDIPGMRWEEAIRSQFPEKAVEMNLHAFKIGREGKGSSL